MSALVDIDLWTVETDSVPATGLDQAWHFLAPGERERIGRVTDLGARNEQLLGRAALRLVLGKALGCAPCEVELTTVGRGKPALSSAHEGASIEFNITHAAGLVLLAVNFTGVALGVDLEGPRDLTGWARIAQRYFSAAECTALNRLHGTARRRGFVACWVRKEALLKGTGGGIASGLSSFDVSTNPGAAPRVIASRNPAIEPSAWQLRDLSLDRYRRGCLAVRSTAMLRLRWQGSPFDAATSKKPTTEISTPAE